jgi:hypothetical protein
MFQRAFLCGSLLLTLGSAALPPALAQEIDLEARANLALSLTQSEVSRVRVQGELGEPLLAVIDLGGSPVTLLLRPRSVRAVGFQLLEQRADGSLVQLDPGPVTTYRGTIVELPGSRVAASLQQGGLFARFFLPSGEEYWLEPLAARIAGAAPGQHVLYRREDVICAGETCGADLLPNNRPKPVDEEAGGALPAPEFLVRVAELACDADYEYFLRWGSSTAVSDRIQTVIGAMNLQYESEVEITHEITTILVRATPYQPYTSTDYSTLLNQFRSEWNGNQAGFVRDVAHLFTGKDLDGNIIGVAWIGAVCNFSYGYGLSQSDFNGNFLCATDLSAHELGHNWNGTHCTCPDSTMNPYITCTNTFSPTYSRPEIIAYRDSVGCLDSGGGGGLSVHLVSDGFESGNLGAGGWSAQNGNASVARSAARTGNFGARLKQTTWIERAVDTSGYPVIRLQYSRRTQGLDANELLYVEWWNGSAWQLVEATSSTSWADQSFLLDAAAGHNPAFRIRFRTDANANNERGDVDNVRVVGS